MKNNIEDLQLKEFIHVVKELIPKEICRFVIDSIRDQEWKKHQWGDNKNNYRYPTKELDVLNITPELEEVLNNFVSLSIKSYNYFIGGRRVSEVSSFSPIRFNRYQRDQIMRKHSDHIKSLFEGDARGIPVLSIIINFNEDYEGGDLVFWNNYKINLGEGDVIVFPSLFLFPHRVNEVTKNIRYSGVCWAW